MSAERNVEQSCSVWEQALLSALFITELIMIMIIIIIVIIIIIIIIIITTTTKFM